MAPSTFSAYSSIEGLFTTLKDPKVVRNEIPFFFGMTESFQPNEIIYMPSKETLTRLGYGE